MKPSTYQEFCQKLDDLGLRSERQVWEYNSFREGYDHATRAMHHKYQTILLFVKSNYGTEAAEAVSRMVADE